MSIVRKPKPQVVDGGDPRLDSRSYRRCLRQFASGVTVVTADVDGTPTGLTVSSLTSLSMDPALVMWSLARNSRSYEAFKAAKHFAVNVLGGDQIEIAHKFSESAKKHFDGVEWSPGDFGSPIIGGAIAVLQCSMSTVYEGGDHIIVVGQVRHYQTMRGEALLYVQGQFGLAITHPDVEEVITPFRNQGSYKVDYSSANLTNLLFQLHYSIQQAFDRHRKSQGLSLPESRALFKISDAGELTPEEVISHTYLTRSVAGDALSSLVERDIVQKNVRGKYILTGIGKEVIALLREGLRELETSFLEGVPKADLEVTRRSISTLLQRLRGLEAQQISESVDGQQMFGNIDA